MARPNKPTSSTGTSASPAIKAMSQNKPSKVQKAKFSGAPIKAARKSKRESAMRDVYTQAPRKKAAQPTEKLGVLFRPTIKTRKAREALETPTQKSEPRVLSVQDIKNSTKHEIPSYSGQPLHEVLPTENLLEICRLVVVQKGRFVYPLWETEREQPDLAMTCRRIRSVTLQVFYAENAFAFQLAPSVATQYQIRRPLLMSKKWISAISAWSCRIRYWIFTDEEIHADESRGTGSLVKLTLPGTPSPFSQAVKADNGLSPRIEIHQDATCLAEHGPSVRCRIMRNPAWLNEAMIKHLQLAGDYSGSMSSAALVELQTCLRTRADDLAKHSCVLSNCSISGGEVLCAQHCTEDFLSSSKS